MKEYQVNYWDGEVLIYLAMEIDSKVLADNIATERPFLLGEIGGRIMAIKTNQIISVEEVE